MALAWLSQYSVIPAMSPLLKGNASSTMIKLSVVLCREHQHRPPLQKKPCHSSSPFANGDFILGDMFMFPTTPSTTNYYILDYILHDIDRHNLINNNNRVQHPVSLNINDVQSDRACNGILFISLDNYDTSDLLFSILLGVALVDPHHVWGHRQITTTTSPQATSTLATISIFSSS